MRRVWLLEPDWDLREVLGGLLESWGAKVEKFGHLEGLSESVEEPEVVLIDLDLCPDEGLELFRTLRRRFPRAVLIVLASWTDKERGRKALREGAFDCLVKPFCLDHLRKVLWWSFRLGP